MKQGTGNSEAVIAAISRSSGTRARHGHMVVLKSGDIKKYAPISHQKPAVISARFLSESERTTIADLLHTRLSIRAVSDTRRSPGCGRTPGASLCRSWTTTSKSGGLSAAPGPSNPSTPATGARSGRGVISPPSRACPEMPLPRRHEGTRPHRQRQGTMGHTMEVGVQRPRHHLRRKNQLNVGQSR